MSVGYLALSCDLINVGDLDLIAQARERCARLVVGVFSDEFAEEHTGRRPVIPHAERAALVRHVRGVDEVVIHDASGRGIPEAAQVFFVSEHAGDDHASLILRRRTRSAVLLETLEPELTGAVA